MRDGYRYWIGVLAIIFLGSIFTVAGAGKLLAGPKGFEPLVLLSFLSQSLERIIYISLPYIEILIGGLLILGIAVKFATSLSALLIIGFIAGNISVIYLGGSTEPCSGCFGLIGELTTTQALVMDGIMAAMVVIIAVCYRGSFFDICPIVLRKERA